jgi:SulP family sulfate permease
VAPGRVWFRSCPREWLRPDVTAGLTTAAVVVPKAIAYAIVAQLPLHVGLHTAVVPMLVYAVLGSSRPLSVRSRSVSRSRSLVLPG